MTGQPCCKSLCLDIIIIIITTRHITALTVGILKTSTGNVTGRHRSLKWKLRAGYRAQSLQRTSYLRITLLLCCTRYVFHRRVWYWPLSLRYACRAYSKFGHHPQSSPRLYLCAKFRFWHALHCWDSPWRISRNQSVTHSINHSPSLFDVPGTEAFASE